MALEERSKCKHHQVLYGTSFFFLARSQDCEKQLLASSCPSVRPSVRMEQMGSHWTDIHEILVFFFNMSRKFVFH